MAGLALLLDAPPVLAFVEDICFPPGGGAPFNCAPLPKECEPAGTTSPACLDAALEHLVGDQTVAGGKVGARRSIVHADCVNLLAQAVGFSAEDADWISAYGEVPDYGQFAVTDMRGQPLVGSAYQTAKLDGFLRTSFATGGVLFHDVPVYNGGAATAAPGIDGLHPKTQAPGTEYFVTHVRNWALAGSGASHPLCAGGLTNQSGGGDYATGAGCFALTEGQARVDWTWALVGPVAKTYSFNTGPQVIDSPDGGPVLSTDFDTTVGGGAGRVANARAGIYLHMLADRISHHACTDGASMAGPNKSGAPTWSESETGALECTQGYHALFHMWETGVEFAKVPPAHHTTEAALDELYDELMVFAARRRTLRPDAGAAASKSALVSAMMSALAVPAVEARIAALAKVACDHGYHPFPGAPACGERGGTHEREGGGATSGGGQGCSCGPGGSCSTVGSPLPTVGGVAWLAVLGVLLRRRTPTPRRRARPR